MNLNANLRDHLASLIKEITGLQRDVKDDDLLIDDLALTSIDYVEIRGSLKDKWRIDLKLSDLSDCVHFGDLVARATSGKVISSRN
jgi:acyl carrier protein